MEQEQSSSGSDADTDFHYMSDQEMNSPSSCPMGGYFGAQDSISRFRHRPNSWFKPIISNDVQTVKVLLAAKVDPNECGTESVKALNHAVDHDRPEIAKLLLENGAVVDFMAPHGQQNTALMAAGIYGVADVARVCLEHGAQVNLRDISSDHWTPLQKSAFNHQNKNQIQTMQTLLQWGADIGLQCHRGYTTDMARHHVKEVDGILAHSDEHMLLQVADGLVQTVMENNIDDLQYLLDKGITPNHFKSIKTKPGTFGFTNGTITVAVLFDGQIGGDHIEQHEITFEETTVHVAIIQLTDPHNKFQNQVKDAVTKWPSEFMKDYFPSPYRGCYVPSLFNILRHHGLQRHCADTTSTVFCFKNHEQQYFLTSPLSHAVNNQNLNIVRMLVKPMFLTYGSVMLFNLICSCKLLSKQLQLFFPFIRSKLDARPEAAGILGRVSDDVFARVMASVLYPNAFLHLLGRHVSFALDATGKVQQRNLANQEVNPELSEIVKLLTSFQRLTYFAQPLPKPSIRKQF